MKYKNNKNVIYSCKYHVVWCTKYKRTVLEKGADERLKKVLKEVAEEISIDILEMEIMPDHVHLIIEVNPQFGIHKAVKRLKGVSSKILREEFSFIRSRIPTLWTNSYFVSTVGGASLRDIEKYINSQKDV